MPTTRDFLALALQDHQAGNFRQAEQLYHQILQADPHHAEAHHLLGVLACQTGRFDQAVTWIQRSLALNPHSAGSYSNLGLAQEGLGQTDEAVASYRKALRRQPNFAEAHNNLGKALNRMGKTDEALGHLREAIRLRPSLAQAHSNLGNVLIDQGKIDEAIACFQHALQISPNLASAHNNLGNALERQNKLDKAIASYHEALRLDPNCVEMWTNLGVAQRRQSQFSAARVSYDQALRLRPDHAIAHVHQAVLLLLQGDFEQGWAEYEWRWLEPGYGRRDFLRPLWDGSPLGGQTILIYAEQGLGDSIQFMRYLSVVRQRGGRVIFHCQPSLTKLLSHVKDIDVLVAQGDEVPAFDFHAPLLSLAGIFHTSPATVPAFVPYLQADEALLQHWRTELRPLDGFKVGIAWQGSPTFRDDVHRSMRLEQFAPLAKIGGVKLVSLQKGSGTDQMGRCQLSAISYQPDKDNQMQVAGDKTAVYDLGSTLDETSGPFMDTAAIMKNLDLIITCDTAVAHLAGALGVIVWVPLTVVPDWRWLVEREDSPWYPSMRLFRQKRYGDWEGVFGQIAAELKALVAGTIRG